MQDTAYYRVRQSQEDTFQGILRKNYEATYILGMRNTINWTLSFSKLAKHNQCGQNPDV